MTIQKIPVLFQTLENFNVEDTRFTRVKIWLMHLEDNMNGSVFSREVVENAIPTLSNTPIMGLLNEEATDFEDHGIDLVENDEGGLDFKHMTVPYGTIPEYNNAQFEDRVGDDGITRTYLTVEGLLWNKWEDGVNALKNKGGLTGQSMEISDYDGQPNEEDGLFHFTTFRFYGACLLGDDVAPAMKNSVVELSFSDKVSEIIKEKLAIYATSIEGGKPLEKDKQEELEKEDVVFDEDDPTEGEEGNSEDPTEGEGEEGSNPEEPEESEEDDEGEDGEEGEGDEGNTPEEPEEPEEPETPEEPEEPEEPETPEEPEEDKKDPEGIEVKTETTLKDARAASNEHDRQVVLPPIERITIGDKVYEAEDVTKLLEIADEHYALLDQLHKVSIDELFAEHSENLTEEEISELKKDAYTKSTEEVETIIYAVIGRKAFSNRKEDKKSATFSTVKVTTGKNSKEPYGGIMERFKKKQ